MGDNNGNAALGAASREEGSGGMPHVASGEELFPEGGIGFEPMRLGEANDVVGKRG